MSENNDKEIWKCEPRVVNVADLIPYENNPRDNNDEAVDAVVESIKKHGYQERILITEDNVIIRGHTRLKAFKKLGWKTVEALVAVGWTPEQINTARLIDNRTQELSLVRPKDLNLELRELPDVEYAKTLGLTDTKAFSEAEFKTSQEETKETKEIDKTQKQIEEGYENREKEKQEDLVKIPCPHCGKIFIMKRKDVELKAKIAVRDGTYAQ